MYGLERKCHSSSLDRKKTIGSEALWARPVSLYVASRPQLLRNIYRYEQGAPLDSPLKREEIRSPTGPQAMRYASFHHIFFIIFYPFDRISDASPCQLCSPRCWCLRCLRHLRKRWTSRQSICHCRRLQL